MFDLYTIYENPRDYPGKFVVRRWVGLKPDPTAEVRDTLADARAAVPVGRVLLSRIWLMTTHASQRPGYERSETYLDDQ